MYGNEKGWPEHLAIIEHPTYGVNDRGFVGLSFSVTFMHGGADLFLPADTVNPLLKEHNIADVARLHGKPCVIAMGPGGGMAYIAFVRFFDTN